MSPFKFYKYATFGLLFLNIAVLAFFLLTKPRPRPRPSSNNFQAEVSEMLGLNSQQGTTFQTLAKEHNQKMISINEQQQKLLRPYFESLTKPAIRTDKAEVLNQIQALEGEKMEVTYQHFQDLKTILNEDQLPRFENFIRRFMDRVLLSKEKNTPPPRDFE